MLVCETARGMRDSPSLDQVVAGRGYVAGNVQLVTTQCNLAKSTLSSEEFSELCEQVYFHSRRHAAAATT